MLILVYTKAYDQYEYLLRGFMFAMAVPLYIITLQTLFIKIKTDIITKIFIHIGTHTLGIYMTNELIIHTFEHNKNFPTSNELLIALIAIFVTAICYMITRLLQSSILSRRIMLGER